jgi:ABC-type antimicrobial peptide transport system permease subunit
LGVGFGVGFGVGLGLGFVVGLAVGVNVGVAVLYWRNYHIKRLVSTCKKETNENYMYRGSLLPVGLGLGLVVGVAVGFAALDLLGLGLG